MLFYIGYEIGASLLPDSRVGSPSSEPAQEAFWKGKAEGVSDIVRRIGRAAANWLLRGGDRRCLFG